MVLGVAAQCRGGCRDGRRLLFIICSSAAKARLLIDGPGGASPGESGESGEAVQPAGLGSGRFGVAVSREVARTIWQSRAGGPLREIEGDGVNIKTAQPVPARPLKALLDGCPEWPGARDCLQIAAGMSGADRGNRPRPGQRVWSGPGARRKCRGFTSWCPSPVRTDRWGAETEDEVFWKLVWKP
jgi:hypothetical protein